MVTCSFCGHDNEDGLLFCDRCKTDLTVSTTASTSPTTAADESPLAGETAIKDTDVPTLHFDKIPLVENLGSSGAAAGDMTRLASGAAEVIPATVPLAAVVAARDAAGPDGEGAAVDRRSETSLKPRLIVIRGEKVDMQYPLYSGKNYLGRTDDKPVDIDLENQEPADRIWTSRQHAVITFENDMLTIEDLNSLNGTFVNRTRVHPNQVRALQNNDIVQVGTVQMRLFIG